MTNDEAFQDFIHPLTHEIIGKNERNEATYGGHARWDWDHENSLLTFSDPDNSTLRIKVTVVGTTQGNSWQWSWANRNFEAHTKLGMEQVRDFGKASGYDQLISPFAEADEYTGWEMTAVAAHVLKALGSYRFPTELGYCYLIYREIEVIPSNLDDIPGAMKGKLVAAPGVDLTEPTGVVWDAEQTPPKPEITH